MKIIISPAKKMNTDTDTMEVCALPVFLNKTEEIMNWIRQRSYEELKKLWACNDRIAEQNFERFQYMDLRENLTPALISYEGIQYQYMAPGVFSHDQWRYVQDHLRILSGFYGVLKPLDGVTPYRLEMQAKAGVLNTKDLYEYWGRSLYDQVKDESGVIINLASKEYSKIIEKYLTAEDTYITVVFGEWKDGKVIQKGTQAKMARGEMVRYMAEKGSQDPREIKRFDHMGYRFQNDLSDERQYVFVKEE